MLSILHFSKPTFLISSISPSSSPIVPGPKCTVGSASSGGRVQSRGRSTAVPPSPPSKNEANALSPKRVDAWVGEADVSGLLAPPWRERAGREPDAAVPTRLKEEEEEAIGERALGLADSALLPPCIGLKRAGA